jgi:general stress protein 26
MSNPANVWKLMRELDFCMLVTSKNGSMRAKPMSTIVDSDAQTAHILTAREGRVDHEIVGDGHVLLNYSNGSSKFVSVNADATVSEDRALVRKLWNPGAQVFWPEGPGSEDVVAVVLRPKSADVWEGDNSVTASLKFAYSYLTGTVVEMGERSHVRMARANDGVIFTRGDTP